MEKLLLEIIRNADQPVLVTTNHMHEIVDQVLEATGERIYFKNDVWPYFTEDGRERQRKQKTTYQLTL